MADIPVSGTSNTTSGLRVNAGDRLVFNPNASSTLTVNVNYANTSSPSNNIIIEGELVMHPANASIIHKIVFTGIDETKMMGGTPADHMNPPTTDPGIWVIMSGKLDIVGATKTSWTDEPTDPADWVGSDTLMKAVWGTSPTDTEASTYTMGESIDTFTSHDGTVQYRERFNLTRNVQFEGQSTGFSHIMIMSDQPQTIKYASFKWWGPAIFSRWTIHFHLVGDGSRGSEHVGLVSIESKGHVYVFHGSYGINYTDCISYHSRGDVFWYDNIEVNVGAGVDVGYATKPPGIPPSPGGSSGIKHDIREIWNAAEDVVMDHCGVFSSLPRVVIVSHPSPGVDVPDPNADAVDGIGFWMEKLRRNFSVTVKNCVVAGTHPGGPNTGAGTGTEKGAFNWDPQSSNFIFFNNKAHNVARAFSFWNNSRASHFLGWEVPPPQALGSAMSPAEKTGVAGYAFFIRGYRPDALQNGAYSNTLHSTGFVCDSGTANGYDAQAVVGQAKPTDITHGLQYHRNLHVNLLGLRGEVRPLVFKMYQTYYGCTFDRVQQRDKWKGTKRDGATPPQLPVYPPQSHFDAIEAAGGDDFTDPDSTIRNEQRTHYQFINCTVPVEPTNGAPLSATPWFELDKKNPDSTFRMQFPDGRAFHVLWGTFPNPVFLPGDQGDPQGNAEQAANGTETWEAIPPFFPYITQTSLPNPVQGVAYSQTLTASLATNPLVWSINPGDPGVPPGLTLSTSGVISGTPTTPGTYPVTIRCRDSNFDATSFLFERDFVMTVVASSSLAIETTSLPNGTVGVGYSQQLQAVDGTGPLTWTVDSGALPTGLSLSSAITGVRTIIGIASNDPPAAVAAAEASIGQQFGAVRRNLEMTTVVPSNNDNLVNQGGQWMFRNSNNETGNPAVAINGGWAGVAAGNADAYLASCVTAINSSSFTAAKPLLWSMHHEQSVVSGPQCGIGCNGTAAEYRAFFRYIVDYMRNAGVANKIKFCLVTGINQFKVNAPDTGIDVVDPGEDYVDIYGCDIYNLDTLTPTSAGLNLVGQYAKDRGKLAMIGEFGIHANTTTAANNLQAALDLFVSQGNWFMVCTDTDTMGSLLLPKWQAAAADNTHFAFKGEATAIPTAGTIAGTPTIAGTSNFVIKVTDQAAHTDTQALQITVASNVPSITPMTLPRGQVAVAYSQVQFQATGGVPPYTWDKVGVTGGIPPGLSLNLSTGVLSGTPTTAGNYNIIIRVKDSLNQFSPNKSFPLVIDPPTQPLTFADQTIPDAIVGRPFSYQFTATGGILPYTFTEVDTLLMPDGYDLSPDGVLSGTPVHTGVYVFRLGVVDATELQEQAIITHTVRKRRKKRGRGLSIREETQSVDSE